MLTATFLSFENVRNFVVDQLRLFMNLGTRMYLLVNMPYASPQVLRTLFI